MEKTPFSKQICFILGFPRSGTNILTRMLGLNTNIYAHPLETLFFSGVVNNIVYRWNIRNNRYFRKFLKKVKDFPLERYFINMDFDDIKKVIECSPPDFGKIFVNLLERNASILKKSCKVIIERSCLHTLFINKLKKFFPNAKFILIVRDPRAVLASLIKPSFTEHSNNFFEQIIFWHDFYKVMKKNINFISQDRLFVLHYEDLVRNPRIVLNDLCLFLGVEFEEHMLHLEDYCKNMPESFYKKIPSYLNKVADKIKTDYIDEWKSILNDKQIEIIEFFAHDFMAKYKYGRSKSFCRKSRVLFFITANLDKYIVIRIIQILGLLKIGYIKPINGIKRYLKRLLFLR